MFDWSRRCILVLLRLLAPNSSCKASLPGVFVAMTIAGSACWDMDSAQVELDKLQRSARAARCRLEEEVTVHEKKQQARTVEAFLSVPV